VNEKPTVAAVVFDMDGVLVDSEPLHHESTNLVLGEHGVRLTECENRRYLGWNERAFWTALREKFGLPGAVPELIRRRQEVVTDLFLKRGLPIADGVARTLEALAARGLPLAVASSSERAVIDEVLARGGIAHFFRAIASGDEVTRGKPDPEIYRLAARRLGVEPARCLAFEDAPHGVRAALAAGMRCVRVVTSTTRDLEFPSVDATIASFRELDLEAVLATGRSQA